MFENVKKSIEKIRGINPKELWLNFSNSQKMHRKDYIDMLTSDTELQTLADEKRLEVSVGDEIKTDFPEISEKSFNLLVDATMHHLRKKKLQVTDDIEFIK